MSNENQNETSLTEKGSGICGGFSKVTLVHMVSEILILTFMAAWIHKKTSSLQKQIVELTQKLDEQTAVVDQHTKLINFLIKEQEQKVVVPPPMRRQQPTEILRQRPVGSAPRQVAPQRHVQGESHWGPPVVDIQQTRPVPVQRVPQQVVKLPVPQSGPPASFLRTEGCASQREIPQQEEIIHISNEQVYEISEPRSVVDLPNEMHQELPGRIHPEGDDPSAEQEVLEDQYIAVEIEEMDIEPVSQEPIDVNKLVEKITKDDNNKSLDSEIEAELYDLEESLN